MTHRGYISPAKRRQRTESRMATIALAVIVATFAGLAYGAAVLDMAHDITVATSLAKNGL